MAITYVGVGTQNINNDNSGTTHTCNFASNSEGDFLLANCACSNGSPNLNPATTWLDETGWTRMNPNTWSSATAGNSTWYYRFAPAGGISSQTFDTAASTGSVTSGFVFQGVDPDTPIDVGPNYNNHTSGTGASVTAPAYQTVTDGAWGCISMNRDGAPVTITFPTSPGTYIDRRQSGSNLPGDGIINCLGTLEHASAGTQTPGAFTWSGNQEACAMSFALRPAPEGGNFNQASFRARNDDGSESAASWKAAINTDWIQDTDENFRIRFLVQEEDDVEDLDVQFQLQYNHNGGGWNDVNGSSSVIRSSASSEFAEGDDTTQQLGAGTFISNNDCMDESNGLVGGANLDWTTTTNQEVEAEFCVQARSADTSPGDAVQLRLIKEADVTFTTYSNTPTLTITPPEYSQTSFRGRNDDGSESGASWKAAADTNWNQAPNENFRVRFLVEETADIADANVGFRLQYNLNAAGWNNVTGASSVVIASASSNLTDGADTTEQLGGPGTFLTPNDGIDEADGVAGGADLDFTSTANQEVEVEYSVQLVDTDVVDFDTVQLRLIVESGTGLFTAYSSIPSITVLFPPDWEMNLSSQFADGDSTTRQLTEDVTKNFVAGKMLEDDATADELTVEENEYTEYEFCIQATSDAPASTEYEFRIKDDEARGEVLAQYDEIPKITTSS